jgi:hypothetical protein
MNGNLLGRRAGSFFCFFGRLFLSFPLFVFLIPEEIVSLKVSAKEKKKRN